MNSQRFKSIIRECIAEILTEDIIRVCSYCELLKPTPPDTRKSHGYCREHYIAALREQMGMSQAEAEETCHNQSQGAIAPFPPNTSGAKATDPLPPIPDESSQSVAEIAAKKICSYCKKDMGMTDTSTGGPSHGICPECAVEFRKHLAKIASQKKSSG